MNEYVQQTDGVYRVAGTRVSLDSVVYAFQLGASAEAIQRSFPSLSLEAVYGAIAFYLAHQDEIEQYLQEGERAFEELDSKGRTVHSAWYSRLQNAKHHLRVS